MKFISCYETGKYFGGSEALGTSTGMQSNCARQATTFAGVQARVVGAAVAEDPKNAGNQVLTFVPNIYESYWTVDDATKAAASGIKLDDKDAYMIKGYPIYQNNSTVNCYAYKDGLMKKWKITDEDYATVDSAKVNQTGTKFFKDGNAYCCNSYFDPSSIDLGSIGNITETGTGFYGFSFYKRSNGFDYIDRVKIGLQGMGNTTTGLNEAVPYIFFTKDGISSFGGKCEYYTSADYQTETVSSLDPSQTYLGSSADKHGVFATNEGLTKFTFNDDQWHDILFVSSRDANVMRIYFDGKPVFIKSGVVYTSEFVFAKGITTALKFTIDIPRDAYYAGTDIFIDNIRRGASSSVILKNKDIVTTETKLANSDGKDAYTGVALEATFPRAEAIQKIKWVFDTAEGRFYSATKDINYNVETEGVVKFAAVTKNGTVQDGAIVGAKEITGIDAILKIGETNYFTNLVDANNMAE